METVSIFTATDALRALRSQWQVTAMNDSLSEVISPAATARRVLENLKKK